MSILNYISWDKNAHREQEKGRRKKNRQRINNNGKKERKKRKKYITERKKKKGKNKQRDLESAVVLCSPQYIKVHNRHSMSNTL